MNGPISIDRIGTDPATVDAAVRLLNTTLGDGLYSHDGLLELDAYEQGFGLKATVDGRLVAASVAQILTPEDMDYYDLFGPPAHDRLHGHGATSLEAVAVEPAHRGKRIGRALLEQTMDWSITSGCNQFVAISWLGERNNPSWPLFEKLGFTAFGESDEIYTRDSIENGWACPVDGNPCHFVATDMAPGTVAGQPVEGYISYTTGDFVIHDETDPTQTDFKGSGLGAAHIPFELFAGHKFSVTVTGGQGGIQAGAYTSTG